MPTSLRPSARISFDSREQRAFRRLLRQERRRPQNHGEQHALALRAEPAARKAPVARALELRHDERAVRCTVVRRRLRILVRRARLLMIDDVFPKERVSEQRHEFLRRQHVRRSLQRIAAVRLAHDVIACAPQLLDMLPDRRARHAELLRDVLARNVRIPCLLQQVQDFFPQKNAPLQGCSSKIIIP